LRDIEDARLTRLRDWLVTYSSFGRHLVGLIIARDEAADDKE
jgi:hypothetical protein